jgi:hypothetical protein
MQDERALPSLLTHGDSFEIDSPWTRGILQNFPAFDRFWAAHIVPLTRRDEVPPSNLVRPNPKPEFNWMADANYAVFYHLTYAHFWTDRVLGSERHETPNPTEGLYCYFSHLFSLIESTKWFALRVNQLTYTYEGANRPFDVSPNFDKHTGEHRTPTLRGRANGERFADFDGVCHTWRPYRNFLVHNGLVFVEGGRIPTLPALPNYSGLTAITKVAAGEGSMNRDFEPASVRLPALNREVTAAINPIWECALRALDELKRQRRIEYSDEQRAVETWYEKVDPEVLESLRTKRT